MKQLEIEFFFPLTQQIPLDLDFTESVAYDQKKKQEMFLENSVTITKSDLAFYTTTSNFEPNFVINIDQTPITVVTKNKPNFVKRWIYKTLGMKWKVK